MMAKLSADLVHKMGPHTSWLALYGGYASDELRAAIKNAGWEGDDAGEPRIEYGCLEDYDQTESFCQPRGNGLFGSPTEEDGNAAIQKLRKALKPFGLKLGKPRRQTWQEAI